MPGAGHLTIQGAIVAANRNSNGIQSISPVWPDAIGLRRGERTNEINLPQNCPRIVAACRQTTAIFCKTKECGSLSRSRYAVLSGLEHLRNEIRPAICGRLTATHPERTPSRSAIWRATCSLEMELAGRYFMGR